MHFIVAIVVARIAVAEKYVHHAPDFVEREADRLMLEMEVRLGQFVAMDGGAA
jgi:hypothetical protein